MYEFTKKYNTFEDWALHQPASTSYTRRIAYLHKKHPDATLSQLRGHAKKDELSLYLLRPRECTLKNMSEFARLAKDFVVKSNCILFDLNDLSPTLFDYGAGYKKKYAKGLQHEPE